VRIGTNLQIAYFDQLRAQLDDSATLVETISPGSDWIEIAGRRTHAMSYLERFLFAPARARSPVGSLSGGERNRLLLARLFARPANLLVLDEPTNDLDIETLELLEELLGEYAGTVLVVSHDRAFLDNVVTQTIVSLGDGRWREQAGGYSDYEAARADEARMAADAKAAAAPTPRETAGAAPVRAAAPATARRRPGYAEQRELDALPDRIAALEQEQKALEQRLADPDSWQDPAAARAMNERFAAIESELLEALERWEALESRRG